MWHNLFIATIQTIYMVFAASFLSIIIGIVLGCILILTSHAILAKNNWIYRPLSTIVNIGRSIPFIILMIGLIPFTRWVVGSSIGINAAVIPLTIAAIPFVARLAENAFNELPASLFETARSLGTSSWQMIRYFVLPESQNALIRIASLTIISLIGYSAMAGAVGGGGLGELAINYGYERFELNIMLLTIAILVCLVQGVQFLGDYFVQRKPYKLLLILCLVSWGIIFAVFFWPNTSQQNPIRIGIISGKQEDIMQVAQQVAKKQYSLNLKIITFNDYVLPNTALNDGDIDANIFQHKPYLDQQMASRDFHLAIIGKTFLYPMGFFSKKISNIQQLPNQATVAIPNDPSNGGRALLVLQQAHLIQINPAAGMFPTIKDITSNPKQLKFVELDAAQLPRAFLDADLVALTNDYIGPAGFTEQQALIKEQAKNNPYVNVIVVRASDVNKPNLKELVEVMHSKEVVAAMMKDYPDGGAIPGW